ncbi:MAG TPA: choice-of-anchor Q domain-containing protein [Puia sp.]|nr:choice-of-anchor Q domain-containing protein [Puia sp.]
MKTTSLVLLLLSLLIAGQAFSTVYYVSPSGNNTSGLSPSTGFRTIQQGADVAKGGDTVFVMNGTYTNTLYSSIVAIINAKGTASNWVVFKNYPGHTPVIKLAANWAGISLAGAEYVIIDGLTIVGYNDSITLSYATSQEYNLDNPYTSANGISIQPDFRNPTNRSSHIIIRNCTVKKCGGGGMGSSKADYITIDNNTVSECGWYGPFDGSAISLYQNWNSDAAVTTKNFITNNTCFNNRNLVPFFAVGSITDGNGIIIDDSRNTQNNSTLGPYKSTTYIANNLVYNNGGRGIHVFQSDNVMVVNNTSYLNCQVVPGDELSAIFAGNISFINNISLPRPGLRPVGQYLSTNIVADYNLWAANDSLANPYGTHTKTGKPLFVIPSANPLVADFHLQPGSIAINAGTSANAPATDHDGLTRSNTDSIDIGAYQVETVLLAIGLTNWAVSKSGFTDKLTWQYGPNVLLDSFEVERSYDGTSFIDLGNITKTTDSSTAYEFIDPLPLKGMNYYRLKVFSAESDTFYSSIISVNNTKSFQATVAPNPVHNQMILTTEFKPGSENLVQVFDARGRQVYSSIISNSNTLINSTNWRAGWYVITLQRAGEKQTIEILKQ